MRHYVPGREHFPGLGPHVGFPEHEQFEIRIPGKLLKDVSGKIVRGCEYVLGNGRIIEEPLTLAIYFAEERNVDQVVRLFNGFGPIHLGPGFQVRRAEAHDDPNAILYRIDVWGTWTIYASILAEQQQQH